MSQLLEEELMLTLNSRFLFNLKQSSVASLGAEGQIKIYKFLLQLYDYSWTWEPQSGKPDVPNSKVLKSDLCAIQGYLKRMDLGHLASKPDDVIAGTKIVRILQAIIDKLETRFDKGLRERINKLHKKELLTAAKSAVKKVPSAPKAGQDLQDYSANNIKKLEQLNAIPCGKQLPRTPVKVPLHDANTEMKDLASSDQDDHHSLNSTYLLQTSGSVPSSEQNENLEKAEVAAKPELALNSTFILATNKMKDEIHHEKIIPTIKVTTQGLRNLYPDQESRATGHLNSTFTLESSSIPSEPVLVLPARVRKPSGKNKLQSGAVEDGLQVLIPGLDATAAKSLNEGNHVPEAVNTESPLKQAELPELDIDPVTAEVDKGAENFVTSRKRKAERIETCDELPSHGADPTGNENGQNEESGNGKDGNVVAHRSKSTRRAKSPLRKGRMPAEAAQDNRNTDSIVNGLAVSEDSQSQETTSATDTDAQKGQSNVTKRGKRGLQNGKRAIEEGQDESSLSKNKTNDRNNSVDGSADSRNANGIDGNILKGKSKSTRRAKAGLPKGKTPTEAIRDDRSKSEVSDEAGDLASSEDSGSQEIPTKSEGGGKEDKPKSTRMAPTSLRRAKQPTNADQDDHSLSKVKGEEEGRDLDGDVVDGKLATKTAKSNARAAQPQEDVSESEPNRVSHPKSSKKTERKGKRKASSAEEEKQEDKTGGKESADAPENAPKKDRAKRTADGHNDVKPASSTAQKKASEEEGSPQKTYGEPGKKAGRKGTRKGNITEQDKQTEDVKKSEKSEIGEEEMNTDATEKENLPSKNKAQTTSVKQRATVAASETKQSVKASDESSEETVVPKRTLRSRKQVNYYEN